MKTLYTLCVLLMLAGCEPKDGDKTESERYYTITYEGCEYLRTGTEHYSQEATMAHKGNCKNPIHQCPPHP